MNRAKKNGMVDLKRKEEKGSIDQYHFQSVIYANQFNTNRHVRANNKVNQTYQNHLIGRKLTRGSCLLTYLLISQLPSLCLRTFSGFCYP